MRAEKHSYQMEKERMMEDYQHRRRQVTLRKKDRYGNTYEISMDFELLGMMQIGGPSYGQSPYSITED